MKAMAESLRSAQRVTSERATYQDSYASAFDYGRSAYDRGTYAPAFDYGSASYDRSSYNRVNNDYDYGRLSRYDEDYYADLSRYDGLGRDYSYGGWQKGDESTPTAPLRRLLRNRTQALEEALRSGATVGFTSWRIPRILHQTWKSSS